MQLRLIFTSLLVLSSAANACTLSSAQKGPLGFTKGEIVSNFAGAVGHIEGSQVFNYAGGPVGYIAGTTVINVSGSPLAYITGNTVTSGSNPQGAYGSGDCSPIELGALFLLVGQ